MSGRESIEGLWGWRVKDVCDYDLKRDGKWAGAHSGGGMSMI